MTTVLRGNDNFDSSDAEGVLSPLHDYTVSGTPSSVSFNLTGFRSYNVDLQNVKSSTNGANLRMQFSANSGSSYYTSNYYYHFFYYAPDGANQGYNFSSGTFIQLISAQGVGSSYSEGGSVNIDIRCAGNSNHYCNGSLNSGFHRDYYGGGRIHECWMSTGFGLRTAAAINNVKFFWSGGNFTQGTIKITGSYS